MPIDRKQNRIAVDISVMVTTVLEANEATIVNLTEYGAQLAGMSLPVGTRFQIDFEEQTVFAIVAWSEIDRVGARFLFSLTDGPLYSQLAQARMTDAVTSAHGDGGWVPPRPTLGSARHIPTGFGRRRA
ncbi:MAG: PilZ domain-containing protein [Sphingobium sp.]